MSVSVSVPLQVAVIHLGFLNLAFGTVPLTFDQWLLCATMDGVVLAHSEVRKLAKPRCITIRNGDSSMNIAKALACCKPRFKGACVGGIVLPVVMRCDSTAAR